MTNILNNSPSTVHKMTPAIVFLGRSSIDFLRHHHLDNYTEIWNKATSLGSEAKQAYRYGCQGPFSAKKLEKGQTVWLHLKNKPRVPCVILADFGDCTLIQKEGKNHRYSCVIAHKSDLSMRFPNSTEKVLPTLIINSKHRCTIFPSKRK